MHYVHATAILTVKSVKYNNNNYGKSKTNFKRLITYDLIVVINYVLIFSS